PVLNKLATLLFLYVVEQHSADFLRLPAPAAFTPAHVVEVEDALARLIEDVRDQAVPLVDALGVSDFRLNSALGRSDGKVYENYLEWAMEDPLNRDGSGPAIRQDWFNKFYKPVLHGTAADDSSQQQRASKQNPRL
ncbi:fatty-acyl coenzyme A oxidase, partial [Coemansia thaxteri]